jgi:hypothetical protein
MCVSPSRWRIELSVRGNRDLYRQFELHGSGCRRTPSSFAPLNLAFVVVKQGKEVHSLLDTNAIATVFTKVE